MSRSVSINEPILVHDILDGEVLVIRNDTGAYYSLIGTAADAWCAIAAGGDEAAIVDVLTSRYEATPAEIAAAVATLVDRLLDEQLVLAVPSMATGDAPTPLDPRLPWSAPTVDVFTDMQDLLLFDPVHEVSPEGWPNVAGGEG